MGSAEDAVAEAALDAYEHHRLLHPDDELPEPGVADALLVTRHVAEHAVKTAAWEQVTYNADLVRMVDSSGQEVLLEPGEAALIVHEGERPVWVKNEGLDPA